MAKQQIVIIAMGSNHDAEFHISVAKTHMVHLFGRVEFSSVKWTVPYGGVSSEKFLNCLAITHSAHIPKLLERALKSIERRCGDSRHERRNGIVNLDLDILLYGDEKMHINDWERPYVKELMGELIKNIES